MYVYESAVISWGHTCKNDCIDGLTTARSISLKNVSSLSGIMTLFKSNYIDT